MKKVKIITIVLAIILVTLIAFGGIYIQNQNRMENKVKNYDLSRELEGGRVIEIQISDGISEDETEKEEGEEKKEQNPENFTEENYEIVKNTIEKRLDSTGAQDYTISLNKENGIIRIELAENQNTDSHAYYLTASGKVQIKEKDTENELISDSMIKKAQYTYKTTSEGSYQVNLELQLNKEGQAKIEEISKEYAILANEIKDIEDAEKSSEEGTEETEQTENTNTETQENQTEEKAETKKIAILTIAGTEYDIEKIEKNKLTAKIGGETSNNTSLNSNMAKAAEISMLINSGKMPIEYEIKTNRYMSSDITNNNIVYFALSILGIIAIISTIFIIKYKIQGLLSTISTIGFIAIFSLLLRYTNVLTSIEGIGAIIFIIAINLYLNLVVLGKIQKINLVDEAMYSTYKDIFLKLVPIMILSIALCFSGWENLTSFGMTMFWGIILIAAYNITVTKTLLKLRENK